MEAKVVRWGDDLAVRLTPAEAEELGIREGETVEMTVTRKAARRRLVNGEPVPTLAEMIAEMERLGPSHRPKTVDWGPDVGAEIIRDD
ncbi:MazF family transcriptional regulator [Methylobacterium hispanicum]|jgi:antitoxin MazE|uniref:AbrB/MazE/SpoVT family DNA-binding domain-containing protein n=1 Tax=Methylobacterium hispanicum TaxID=270350 RepID=UPI0019DACFE8|nr:MazF family transcriptional regulator [Parafilimonas terrae]